MMAPYITVICHSQTEVHTFMCALSFIIYTYTIYMNTGRDADSMHMYYVYN